jgi:FkbM family methyltransferase
MNYYSQLGQDKFIDEYLDFKEGGVFIDIGAHDGQSCSNSLFFEEHRNWTGVCIEPGPEEFKKLNQNRKSININACISDYDGESEFTYIEGYSNMLSGLSESYNESHENRILNEVRSHGGEIHKINMPVFKLQTILDKYNICDIDMCSIDTEGSEFNIIKSIDFSKTNIKIFTIENNYQTTEIKDYLEDKGYDLYCKIQWDDVFIKKNKLTNEKKIKNSLL